MLQASDDTRLLWNRCGPCSVLRLLFQIVRLHKKYHCVTITMLNILPLPALKDNYIWLCLNEDNGHTLIVDPSEAQPVLDYLSEHKFIADAILITHHHWDHVGGIPDITAKYDIPVFTPASETVKGSTHGVREGDVLPFPELNLSLKILDVPGHTAGAVAYYSDNFVFSGDTLFTAGCGRIFEGTPQQMHASLEKFRQLDENTRLFCGHEYTEANLGFASTVEPHNKAISERLHEVRAQRQQQLPTVPATLATEKLTNPFLRCHEQGIASAVSNHVDKELSDPVEVFAALRQWKDNF